MALHTGSNSNNTTSNNAPTGAASNTGNGYENPQPYRAPSFGISNQMSGMGSGGEYYERLYGKLQACVKRQNEEGGSSSKFGIQKLLKSPAGLRYAGIILTERVDDIVSAHILVVERTGTYPDALIETYDGTRYEIARTPAEALDVKYVDQAILAISSVLKVPASNIVVADGTLVPNEFDLESEFPVSELFNNSFSATRVEVQTRVDGYRGTDIADIVKQAPKGRFTINLYFDNEGTTYLDQTGMPVRQDICVELSFKSNVNQNSSRSINQSEDVIEIVKTYGYIDFEYTGPTVINGQASTQKFSPNFIITHIDSPKYALTPDIVMMAVASVMSITENMAWTQAFRPTQAKKNHTDFNDIGALNVDGNLEQNQSGNGKRFDTKAKATTGDMELSTFISQLVRTSMMVSIDIPKAGPETWHLSAFRAATGPGNTDARQRIMSFMTNATGGAYVDSKVSMFDMIGPDLITNKIHGGYYKTNGVVKDLRCLSSYLAVANHVVDSGQQPIILTQYTNTMYSNLPAVLRAVSRKEYIDQMANGKSNVVVKQMYDRFTFNGMFLAGWITTLRAVGFTPVFSSGGNSSDMFTRRATANFQNAAMQQDVRLMSQQNAMPGNFGQYGYYNRSY